MLDPETADDWTGASLVESHRGPSLQFGWSARLSEDHLFVRALWGVSRSKVGRWVSSDDLWISVDSSERLPAKESQFVKT